MSSYKITNESETKLFSPPSDPDKRVVIVGTGHLTPTKVTEVLGFSTVIREVDSI